MGKVLDALKMLTGHYWIADAEKALLSEAIQILQDATAQPVEVQPAALRSDLHDFLDAAAAEGFILGGVDSAELYQALFPKQYASHGIKPAMKETK